MGRQVIWEPIKEDYICLQLLKKAYENANRLLPTPSEERIIEEYTQAKAEWETKKEKILVKADPVRVVDEAIKKWKWKYMLGDKSFLYSILRTHFHKYPFLRCSYPFILSSEEITRQIKWRVKHA